MQREWTISSWSLGDRCSFADRVRSAKKAGFSGIGLRAETYADARNEGLSDQEILAILARYEMKVTEVEYIVQWADPVRSYEQKYKEQLCFHMCELFGVKHINCGLMEHYPLEHTAQKLRELCTRAGKLQIGIEPMPYSGIPTVKAAWELLQAAGCDNAKIILDSWHWIRANQSYDPSELAGIPAEAIISIQVNDVHDHPFPTSVLREESMHDRLAPGTGVGDTVGFLKMVYAHGIQPKVVGVEVISDPILSRGVEETAKYLYETMEHVWKEAGL